MEPIPISRPEVTMVVPNKIVKKLFENVLKSVKMKTFVKQYNEDGANWMDLLTELTVAFSITLGEECHFSNLERLVRLRFRENLKAKSNEKKEAEDNKSGRFKPGDGSAPASQTMSKSQPLQGQVVKTNATASNKKSTKKTSEDRTTKIKPILAQRAPGKTLKRKRMVEVEVMSSEEDDTRGGKSKTAPMKIPKAKEAKNIVKTDKSEQSKPKIIAEKPKKRKSFVQDDKKAKEKDDDVETVEIFRCPRCKMIFEDEADCLHHIEVTHK